MDGDNWCWCGNMSQVRFDIAAMKVPSRRETQKPNRGIIMSGSAKIAFVGSRGVPAKYGGAEVIV